MLQFYFLSIASNFLAGLSLAGDWIGQKIPGTSPLTQAMSGRRAKLICGLASLLVGFATLFVPADGNVPFGDLFPSAVGMVMGIALLFEVLRQDAVLPGEHPENPGRPHVGYRTTLGMLGIAAAILHFFLPERLFF